MVDDRPDPQSRHQFAGHCRIGGSARHVDDVVLGDDDASGCYEASCGVGQHDAGCSRIDQIVQKIERRQHYVHTLRWPRRCVGNVAEAYIDRLGARLGAESIDHSRGRIDPEHSPACSVEWQRQSTGADPEFQNRSRPIARRHELVERPHDVVSTSQLFRVPFVVDLGEVVAVERGIWWDHNSTLGE